MQFKSRLRAFGVHLLGSMLVGMASAAVVFGVWYPGPLRLATGVADIFWLMLLVDVIVGPVITLIVFDPRKRELRRDLAVVVMLQLGALGIGLHTVFVARPVYLAFSVDRFELVYANDLTPEKLSKVTNPAFAEVPLWGPRVVAATRPTDAQARMDITLGALAGGDDVAQLPQFYVAYPSAKADVVSRLQPLAALEQFNARESASVKALIAKYASVQGGVGFVPVRGKTRDLAAIIGKESGELLETVALNPWP